jgi:hypothetical protein
MMALPPTRRADPGLVVAAAEMLADVDQGRAGTAPTGGMVARTGGQAQARPFGPVQAARSSRPPLPITRRRPSIRSVVRDWEVATPRATATVQG